MEKGINLLTNKSRFQEIYDFRVQAWENSPAKETVNKTLFPNGWSDSADNYSFIWYKANDLGQVIATARLTYFNKIEDAIDVGLNLENFELPPERPFGFFSRLAIDKSFRGKGLSKCFDEIRINKLKNDNIKFALVEVITQRVKGLESLGFKVIGTVNFKPNSKGQEEILNLMIYINN
ncbi:GNAT family N-acetyltransferase [Aureispira anguillae]|uniref:GNAT family N-acetyltransferase n=1 Tax=Aureispira anguillae TaxID=2864201 RepID=A0A916DVD5_9BACT|nr:GNAT family N-acetyltransferase [Aureispira anguillae]BDS13435.1 GNAT family N-acetyltransferase [Aureispira anguillae]